MTALWTIAATLSTATWVAAYALNWLRVVGKSRGDSLLPDIVWLAGRAALVAWGGVAAAIFGLV